MNRFILAVSLMLLAVSCNKQTQATYTDNSNLDYLINKNDKDTTQISSQRLLHLKNGLVLEKIDTNFFLEGDMRYNSSQLASLSELTTDTYRSRSESISSFPTYWNGRNVPFDFDSSCTTSFQTTAYSAMNTISSVCGVRFIPATTQTDKIVFHQSTSGNNSSVGKVGGSQPINITSTSESTIIHEILHALGFYHEHSRDDRDNYLTINWSNIKREKRHNFNKYTIGLCTTPVDLSSIMIYRSFTTDASFVYDVNTPMLTDLYGGHISWPTVLSSLDIQDLRNIYGPPYHKMDVSRELIYEYYSYGTEIYENEVTYTISFYSDEDCTIPVALPYDRSVIIEETNTYCDVFQQMHSSSISYAITIPSGSSSHVVASHRDYEYYAYGSPSNIDIVSYSIVNYHHP